MQMLVQIRGTNGSGKSTVPMQMIKHDPDHWVEALGGTKRNPKAPYLTVLPKYGFAVIGSYNGKTGGLDRISGGAANIRKFIVRAMKRYPEYDILMEGFIASGSVKPFIQIFKEFEDMMEQGTLQPRKILVINFLPPIETCIERVYKRNGGKKIAEENVLGKYETVRRNVKTFRKAGFTSVRLDTSVIPRKKMKSKFLHIVEKYRPEED